MISLLCLVVGGVCQEDVPLVVIWFQNKVIVSKDNPWLPRRDDLETAVDLRLDEVAAYKLEVFKQNCRCDAAQLAELEKLALRWKSGVRREVAKLRAAMEQGGQPGLNSAHAIAKRINSRLECDPYRTGTLAKKYIAKVLNAEQKGILSAYRFSHDDQVLFDLGLGLTAEQVAALRELIAAKASGEDQLFVDVRDFWPALMNADNDEALSKLLSGEQREYLRKQLREFESQ